MKVKDVPQDKDPSYEGSKKLCYAQDENGQFVQTSTSGWTVEETVKSLAWQVIEKDLERTRQNIKLSKESSLTYFMKIRQMDTQLLAQNMGISSIRAWWHQRPNVFRKLKINWLQKYSECLDIPVETLRSYNGESALNIK